MSKVTHHFSWHVLLLTSTVGLFHAPLSADGEGESEGEARASHVSAVAPEVDAHSAGAHALEGHVTDGPSEETHDTDALHFVNDHFASTDAEQTAAAEAETAEAQVQQSREDAQRTLGEQAQQRASAWARQAAGLAYAAGASAAEQAGEVVADFRRAADQKVKGLGDFIDLAQGQSHFNPETARAVLRLHSGLDDAQKKQARPLMQTFVGTHQKALRTLAKDDNEHAQKLLDFWSPQEGVNYPTPGTRVEASEGQGAGAAAAAPWTQRFFSAARTYANAAGHYIAEAGSTLADSTAEYAAEGWEAVKEAVGASSPTPKRQKTVEALTAQDTLTPEDVTRATIIYRRVAGRQDWTPAKKRKWDGRLQTFVNKHRAHLEEAGRTADDATDAQPAFVQQGLAALLEAFPVPAPAPEGGAAAAGPERGGTTAKLFARSTRQPFQGSLGEDADTSDTGWTTDEEEGATSAPLSASRRRRTSDASVTADESSSEEEDDRSDTEAGPAIEVTARSGALSSEDTGERR